MKVIGSLCLGLVVVALAAADDQDKKGAIDPAKLAGQWTYVSGVRNGEKVDKDHLTSTVTVSKETFTLPTGEGQPPFVIAYKINAKASPATIDMEIKDGPVKEGKAEGIIALNGDELKICYTPSPGKRPTKFESTADSNAFYFVLKRKK